MFNLSFFSLTVSDLFNLCKSQFPQCRKTILRIKRKMETIQNAITAISDSLSEENQTMLLITAESGIMGSH